MTDLAGNYPGNEAHPRRPGEQAESDQEEADRSEDAPEGSGRAIIPRPIVYEQDDEQEDQSQGEPFN